MIIKYLVDCIYNTIKGIEETLTDCKTLDIRRSIQLDNYSCGAHCAYMILGYYDIDALFTEVVNKLKTNVENGTDTKPILKLLKEKGLDVVVNEKTNLSYIKTTIDNSYPLLISVDNGDHWIVIYGYSNAGIFVLDPSMKKLLNLWSMAEFMKRWDDNWAAVIKEK